MNYPTKYWRKDLLQPYENRIVLTCSPISETTPWDLMKKIAKVKDVLNSWWIVMGNSDQISMRFKINTNRIILILKNLIHNNNHHHQVLYLQNKYHHQILHLHKSYHQNKILHFCRNFHHHKSNNYHQMMNTQKTDLYH